MIYEAPQVSSQSQANGLLVNISLPKDESEEVMLMIASWAGRGAE